MFKQINSKDNTQFSITASILTWKLLELPKTPSMKEHRKKNEAVFYNTKKNPRSNYSWSYQRQLFGENVPCRRDQIQIVRPETG